IWRVRLCRRNTKCSVPQLCHEMFVCQTTPERAGGGSVLRAPLQAVFAAQTKPEPRQRKAEPQSTHELLDRLEPEPHPRNRDPRENERLRASVGPPRLRVAADLVDLRILVVAWGASRPVIDRQAGDVSLTVRARRHSGLPGRGLVHPVVDEIAKHES